ncbi:MAG: hypothetical protein L0387_04140, partial [Acidobacteria bacterium]|nr:hypothetical protein [Acidobacteriota bacterium]
MLDFLRICWSGLQQVRKSAEFILLMYAISVLVALPLALHIRAEIKTSLNNSVVHENLRQGFDFAWYWQAFPRQGLAETFGPLVVGALPIVSNLERLLDGEMLNTNWIILAGGILFLLSWTFLNGGILDRYLNPEDSRTPGRFMSSCERYFFRFSRLLLVSAASYYFVFKYVVSPLHKWIADGAKETTSETTVMLRVMGIYVLAGGILILCGILLDYARIILVAEDRRSVLVSCLSSIRFVLRYPISTLSLYVFLLIVSGLVVFLYALAAPGPKQTSWSSLLMAFALGQAYLVVRLFCKLSFSACQS